MKELKINYLSRQEKTYWEGDGMRPGDNIRSGVFNFDNGYDYDYQTEEKNGCVGCEFSTVKEDIVCCGATFKVKRDVDGICLSRRKEY